MTLDDPLTCRNSKDRWGKYMFVAKCLDRRQPAQTAQADMSPNISQIHQGLLFTDCGSHISYCCLLQIH